MLRHKREKYPHSVCPSEAYRESDVICILVVFTLLSKVLPVVQRYPCPLTSLKLLWERVGILPLQRRKLRYGEVQGPAQMVCSWRSQDINLDLLKSSWKLPPLRKSLWKARVPWKVPLLPQINLRANLPGHRDVLGSPNLPPGGTGHPEPRARPFVSQLNALYTKLKSYLFFLN